MALLGLEAPAIWLAYLLSIAAALLCVIYGILNWNKGAEGVSNEAKKWVEEEKELEEEL